MRPGNVKKFTIVTDVMSGDREEGESKPTIHREMDRRAGEQLYRKLNTFVTESIKLGTHRD